MLCGTIRLILLSVFMLNVIMLTVIMLYVVAPVLSNHLIYLKKYHSIFLNTLSQKRTKNKRMNEVFEKIREIQKTFELEQNLGNLVFTNYPNYLSKVSLP
jgi:hypothetical protein